MSSTLTANVILQGGVHFVGQTHTDHRVVFDYPPPLGQGDGFSGLEVLLLSLAGCSGQTVVTLLRRMKQAVAGLEVQATAQRREEHPTVLTQIQLVFTVTGTNLDPAAIDQAIHLSEEQFCPVWSMLKGGTQITASYQIENAAQH